MRLTTHHHDPPLLAVHAPQQQQREKPVAQVVASKGHVEPRRRPRLRRELEVARVEDQRADGGDLSRCDPRVYVRRHGAHASQVRKVQRDDVVRVARGAAAGVGVLLLLLCEGRPQGGRVLGVAHRVEPVVGRQLGRRPDLGGHLAAQAAVCACQEDGALPCWAGLLIISHCFCLLRVMLG